MLLLHPLHHRYHHLLHFSRRILDNNRHFSEERLTDLGLVENDQTVNLLRRKRFLVNPNVHRLELVPVQHASHFGSRLLFEVVDFFLDFRSHVLTLGRGVHGVFHHGIHLPVHRIDHFLGLGNLEKLLDGRFAWSRVGGEPVRHSHERNNKKSNGRLFSHKPTVARPGTLRKQ